MKKKSLQLIAAAASLALPISAWASITIDTVSNATGQSTFDANILTNDLGSTATLTGNTPSLGSLAGIIDGAGSPVGTDTNATLTNDAYYDGSAGFGTQNILNSSPAVTFTFNTNASTGGSASGYTLTGINSVYGWHDHASMSDQNYTVAYSTVSNPNVFTTLTSINYHPFDPVNDNANAGAQYNSSQVKISDTTGSLASQVAAVRVTFSAYRNGNNIEQAGQLVREFDITSTATTNTPTGPKILPLGDSITDGFNTPGGYRIKLYQNLGGNVQFLGSQTNGPSNLPDKHNEGHSGYRIDQIDGDLKGLVSSSPAPDTNNGGYWLTGGNGTGRGPISPDIVLLHIGTNDASQGFSALTMEQRLTTLLGDLKTDLPNSQFIVASLILRTDSSSAESVEEQYNAAMPGIVNSFGSNFHFFDMHSVLTAGDLADGVHPTSAGYNKMADAWTGAIAAVPEPSSIMLITLASGSLLLRKPRGT